MLRYLLTAAAICALTACASASTDTPDDVSMGPRATQLTGRVPAILLGFVSAIGLSVFGYWVVWKYFSGLSLVPVPIETALQMGLIPGAIMGLILAADSLFRRA